MGSNQAKPREKAPFVPEGEPRRTRAAPLPLGRTTPARAAHLLAQSGLLMHAPPSVPLSSLLAVARRLPCSWPAIDTCALCLPSRIAPAGIRPPPARLDMQHARPRGSIMPLRVAIARTSKHCAHPHSTGVGQITRAAPFLGGSLVLM